MIKARTISRPLRKPEIYKILLPLSWLYEIGIRFRNWLFDCDLIRSKQFDLPVISVGNITVGGTGKTPHTEYIVELLKDSYHVAVLSRGYKRESKGFVQAQKDKTNIADIGDEPFQMWSKYPEATFAVDSNRCNGIEHLIKGNVNPHIDVVILDDAFQHRYVKPDINIILVNYYRPIFLDKLLPAGRLREPIVGKNRADIIIVTKCPKDLTLEEIREFENNLNPRIDQNLFFTTFTYGDLYSINDKEKLIRLKYLSNEDPVLLLTGIASPTPIIEELNKYTQNIHPVTFADHHQFGENDFKRIRKEYDKLPADRRMIITTEKDAARLLHHPLMDDELKSHCYVLPIKVEFLNNSKTIFNKKIQDYVRKNTRNSVLSKE